MTRIDFYVLAQENPHERVDFACRVIEKAVKNGNSVVASTQNTAQSTALDKALWSVNPESFIPHLNLDDDTQVADPAYSCKVIIANEPVETNSPEVLINLSNTVPAKFSSFERVIEIVIQDGEVLKATRKNHQFYKDRGYPIFLHKL